MRPLTLLLLCTICVLSSVSGCSPLKDYQPYPNDRRTVFSPAVRSAAPEPAYARTRWVLPPEVLPAREVSTSNSPTGEQVATIRPVFHLKLKRASLEETARLLSAMGRYSSYTAPSIAKKTISIENLGTIDELARIIERTAKVRVVVDHENREVRFLAAHADAPRLISE